MQRPLKVIITGGGTGGHIFPAIAIANAIKKGEPSAEILFIGALGKMEMEKIPKAGYPIQGLPIAGLQRRWTWKNLLLPFKLIDSLNKARTIINNFSPQAVIGVGGYASAPVVFVATVLGIPSLIQEQNSYAGITNKLLGKRVQKICVAFEGMEQFFPMDKIVFTGNPVREDILHLEGNREKAYQFFGLNKERETILVIGGSLGARTINETVRSGLSEIMSTGLQLIWQTGKGYYNVNAEAALQYPGQVKVYEFIDRMDLAYAVADVVISRAGAISIAELSVAKKACVLVPSPNVAEDHQTKNAIALQKNEAAIMVKDSEAKTRLVNAALQLIKDKTLRERLQNNINRFARPHADEDIAREVFKMVNINKEINAETINDQ